MLLWFYEHLVDEARTSIGFNEVFPEEELLVCLESFYKSANSNEGRIEIRHM
jgi:hypothetical protein